MQVFSGNHVDCCKFIYFCLQLLSCFVFQHDFILIIFFFLHISLVYWSVQILHFMALYAATNLDGGKGCLQGTVKQHYVIATHSAPNNGRMLRGTWAEANVT